MHFGNTSHKLASIALALTGFATSATAVAQAPDSRMEVVHIRDLDLTSQADLARLDARLNRAVRVVCGQVLTPSSTEFRNLHACRTAAWISIEPQRSFYIARANTAARTGEVASRESAAAIRIAVAD